MNYVHSYELENIYAGSWSTEKLSFSFVATKYQLIFVLLKNEYTSYPSNYWKCFSMI